MKLSRDPRRSALTLIFLMTLLSPLSCGKDDAGSGGSTSSTELTELGQQVGDVMASIDEFGTNTGTISEASETRTAQRLFARHARPSPVLSASAEKALDFLLPSAQAATCSAGAVWSTCAGGISRTLTFGGCTVGSATFSGTVGLTYSVANACSFSAAGDTLTRVPSFTVTGRLGATLTVSKTGTVGQRLTWASGTGTSKVFFFSNDGIRRVFSSGGTTTAFDFTTSTTSALTLTGTSRSSRVLSGGTLRVTNNLTSVTCDYVPSSVSWTTTCNCPTSGRWSGSCSDGSTTLIVLSGCGTASITQNTSSGTVVFDRCEG